jgi:hypothetical protein
MISSTRESVTHALARDGEACSQWRTHDHPGPAQLGACSRHVVTPPRSLRGSVKLSERSWISGGSDTGLGLQCHCAHT